MGIKQSTLQIRGAGSLFFVRFQNLKKLMKSGDLKITKDDVTYKGDRVDLICRFLRTHQVLEIPMLCECIKNGNVHLINQMDAFFGGLKTLLIKFREPDVISSYASQDDVIYIPYSAFLRDFETEDLLKFKNRYVLKFGNRGGGKRVYFGTDISEGEWYELIKKSRGKYSETAMIQEVVKPSITPSFDNGRVSLQNTTCDVFVFTTDRSRFGGVFSRWSYQNLVNFKTGGIKETVFI